MRVIQTDDVQELHALAKQLATSKRVAIICGAGISTAAGIPDFRSATTGLFASLKEKNPDLKINSGKDLFHTNLFQREDTTRAFYQMCAEMKRMANAAPPTEFHELMKDLDDANKLFRIYTQNIDSLEAKAGLSFGLGEWQERERLVSKPKARGAGKGNKKGLSQKVRGKQRALEDEEPAASEAPALEGPPPHTQSQADQLPLQEEQQPTDQESLLPQASTSHSPRISTIDSIQTSQTPSTSLLFGGSSQLDHALPPSAQEDVSIPQRKGSSPVFPTQSYQELVSMHFSPSGRSTGLPSTAETASTKVVPDSQEGNDTTMTDTSALTDLSRLTDMSNASITDILQMPFCSQESSFSDGGDADTSRNAPVPTSFPSLALTQEEQSQTPNDKDLLSSQKSSIPAPKQIQIQRFLTVPRVIPLHGTLDEMHCPKCNHIERLEHHIEILESGHSIHCPKCLEQDFSRTALGERSRGVGVLKVSVVLYGEEHKQASRVGEIAEKDLLKAARPDVLLVAGTTLRIPGVKKIVKELAKVIKQPIREAIKDEQGNPTGEFTEREDPTKRVIFVNRDSPNPEKTWSEVFDTFVQGDAQTFARLLRQEIQALKDPPPTQPQPPQPLITAVTAVPPSTAAYVLGLSPSAIADDVAAKIVAQNKTVQTSLSDCWHVVKKASPAPPASQKPVHTEAVPIPSINEMLSSAPIKLGDTLAFKSSETKIVSVKGPKAIKESKKVTTNKQNRKEKLFTPKAPSPQPLPVVEAESPQITQQSKMTTQAKRAPAKAPAKRRAKQTAKGKAARAASMVQAPEIAPVKALKEKVKTKPGWRGYVALGEGEVYTPKYKNLFEETLPEGSTRRRSVLPSHTQPRSAPSQPLPAKAEIRETTPVSAPVAGSSAGAKASDILSFAFPPLKGSNWPNSAHPSIASSTPPSLDSDREAFSDSDETASYKGEYEVSVSQETVCIPPTFSAEEATASFPSSGQQTSTHSKSVAQNSSSPVIIEDSLSLEEAASISAMSSSQSPMHAPAGKSKNKRSAPPPQAGSFLTSCSTAVKRTSHRPSSAKRMKVQV